MFNKVNNLIKNNDLVISNLLFFNYKKLDISFEELYYLIYLTNLQSLEFNMIKISKDLNKKPKEILKIINNLDEKELIELKVEKNSDEDIKEIISLEKLYKKLTFLIIENENCDEEKIDIIKEFETVFKRDLTGREKQIINAWKSVGYKDEFVLEGLKEAKYNGEYSFSYIDNILDGWDKQGISTKEDVIKSKTIKSNTPIENTEPIIEIDDDYDWMNE